jgi:hypothetical protein
MNDPSYASPKKKGSWLWIILGLVLLGLPVLGCGGCFYFLYSMGVAPINAAVASLNDDAEVSAKLGTPIKMVSGLAIKNLENNNGNGSAELEFNASGPNGSAKVSGKMKLIAGTWSPDGLVVTYDDGTTKTLQ